MFLDVSDGLNPEELDGKAVEASLIAPRSVGGRVRSKAVRLHFDGDDGA